MTVRITVLVAITVLALLQVTGADMRGEPVCGVPTGEALVLTWQNDYGRWFACGPIQNTLSGERTESKAMGYVYNERRGTPDFVCRVVVGKGDHRAQARLYRLGHDLESYDINCRRRIVR